nr:ABC transporter ATP-binding protein [Spirochaeta sp.]
MADIHIEEEEFTTQDHGKVILRILSLLKPHLLWTLGFLLLIALVSVLDAFFTYISKLMIDQGILKGDYQTLLQLILIYGGLALIQAIFVFGFIFLAGILGERIQYDLRKKMFDHLQTLSFSYFDRTPVGWIMSRVTSDSGKISELVTWGLVDVTWAIMNISTSLVFMIIIHWRLALIVLAVVPVMVWVAVIFQRKILEQYRQVRKQNSRLTGSFNEMITGVRVIKALCREEQNLEEFSLEAGSMYQASYRAAWFSAFFLPCVQIIGSLALGAIIWYGGLEKMSGEMTLGGIQAFIFYVAFILWPVQDLARVWASMQNS